MKHEYSKPKPTFPKLEGKMGENGHDTHFLARYLGISVDTVRRSLNGSRQFELEEILKLMTLYNCTFEDLFQKYSSTA